MLVLTRRVGDRIVINDEIHVTVVSISGGKVRLGFDAPRSSSVVRAELLARQRQDAALPAAQSIDTPVAPREAWRAASTRRLTSVRLPDLCRYFGTKEKKC